MDNTTPKGAMTDEQRSKLRNMIIRCEQAFANHILYETRSETEVFAMEDIAVSYVDDLLAAKDAEIARLKAEHEEIFSTWRAVGAEDGFIVTSDCLKLYHAIKPLVPEIKKHAERP